MSDNPYADACLEFVRELEKFTKMTGVKIDIPALRNAVHAREMAARPQKPKLRIISTDRPYNNDDEDDGA